jgi:hypothetical protein
MGYSGSCTAVAGVSEKQRHELTGMAMDRHAVVQLVAVYSALSRMSAEFEGVASLAYAPAAVPHRCLPPLSAPQLRSMCPWAMQQFESMGWVPGEPVGDARQGGLLWPLDHEGLEKGAGIGYVAKQPAGGAQALYSSAARGVLPSVPEGEMVCSISCGIRFTRGLSSLGSRG